MNKITELKKRNHVLERIIKKLNAATKKLEVEKFLLSKSTNKLSKLLKEKEINRLILKKNIQKLSKVIEEREHIRIKLAENAKMLATVAVSDKENLQRYLNIFNNAPDAIFLADINTRKIVDCNKTAEALIGYTKKEIVNMFADNLHPKDRIEETMKAFKKQLKNPSPVRSEILTKTKKRINVSINASVVKINNKPYLQGIFRDIDNIIYIEKNLQEKENIFKEMFKRTNFGIVRVGLDFKFIETNPYFCKMLGYSENEMTKMSFVQITHPDEGRRDGEVISKLIKNEIPYYQIDKRYINKKGEVIWANTNVILINDTEGKPSYLLAVIENITERFLTHQKLKEYSERLDIALRAGQIGIWDWDITKDNLVWDDNIYKMYGVPANSFRGGAMNWSKYIIPEDRPRALSELQAALRGEREYMPEFRISWPDGSIHNIKANSKTFFDNKGKAVRMVGTNIDITKIKKIEEDLIKSKEILDQAQEISNSGSYSLDIISGKWSSSKSLNKIFGIDDKYPHTVEGWGNLVYFEDRKYMLDYFIKEVLGKGSFFDKVYRVEKKNDGSVLWVHGRGRLEFDKNNKPIRMIGTIQDITESKELDDAKSGFLAIASHQLRTPLSMTKWVLESLIEQGSLNPLQQSKLNDLTYSNERLIHLVNALLKVSSIDTGKLIVNKKNIDISDIVKKIIASLSSLILQKNKNIETVGFSKPNNVYGDPIAIYEVIENLLTNAIVYSSQDSKNIKIAIKERKNDYLVYVRNDGVISKNSLKRIRNFDKFSRGHNASEIQPTGSGLGLYITKKVIEASGGELWLESNAKSGTTFYFTITKSKIKK